MTSNDFVCAGALTLLLSAILNFAVNLFSTSKRLQIGAIAATAVALVLLLVGFLLRWHYYATAMETPILLAFPTISAFETSVFGTILLIGIVEGWRSLSVDARSKVQNNLEIGTGVIHGRTEVTDAPFFRAKKVTDGQVESNGWPNENNRWHGHRLENHRIAPK